MFEDHIDDDVLRLMFVACHPVLAVRARTALTLRLVGGLTTAEIARAYLEPEATVAQRIVRAKRAIAAAGIPFEVPEGDDRDARLSSVLEVVYVIFNEGYSATAGADWTRPTLCAEALRLGRVLSQLAPEEAEVHGLTALMEIQSSRLGARIGPEGQPVLLFDQDRRSWDRLLINRGLAALERARALGGQRGPYALQAAVAACHAQAFRAEDTDWMQVVALYAQLAEVSPSPIVELNRAVAVSMAYGPGAGLELVDQLRATGTHRPLPPAPRGAGRSARQAGPPPRGRRGVHPGGLADPQPVRAAALVGAGRGHGGRRPGPTGGRGHGGRRSQLSGFSQRRPSKREKSESLDTSTSPCSMAIAARCRVADQVRGSADRRSTGSRKISPWRGPGSGDHATFAAKQSRT